MQNFIRPLTAKIKKSIFDSIGTRIKNAEILDLFAGIGSFSYEALLRGAKSAVLVEKSNKAVKLIKKNLNEFENSYKILKMDCEKAIKRINDKKFNLIFCDPPFRYKLKDQFLKELIELLKADGYLLVRRHWRNKIGLGHTKEIKYGEQFVYWFTPNYRDNQQ